jgi:flagellar hook-associated protein 3 FlgL
MMSSINRNRPREAVQSQLDLSQAITAQQNAIATGKRLTVASDDPQGWLEISLVARQQGDEAAWTANIGRAETRAVQAESGMNELAAGLRRAKELVVQASNGTFSDADRGGIATELEGILANFRDLLGLDDSFGGKLFGDAAIEVPIGGTRTVVAAPTLAKLSGGIDDDAGGTTNLELIMQATIDAIRGGDAAQRSAALTPLNSAIDHVSVMLTEQGVARGRLESARNQFLDSKIVLAERRQQIESVDITDAITRLQALDISLQAAQSVYGRITQRSLLDFLR